MNIGDAKYTQIIYTTCHRCSAAVFYIFLIYVNYSSLTTAWLINYLILLREIKYLKKIKRKPIMLKVI